jgi:hypothetical protein
MKKLVLTLAVALVLAFTTNTFAAVRVSGYTTKNGTYVAPHYRTSPNYTTRDNYSTKGNYNPYTGKYGTKNYGY